jgi:hypothetical protein
MRVGRNKQGKRTVELRKDMDLKDTVLALNKQNNQHKLDMHRETQKTIRKKYGSKTARTTARSAAAASVGDDVMVDVNGGVGVSDDSQDRGDKNGQNKKEETKGGGGDRYYYTE